VWPKEFQDPEWYFRAGTIADWDKHPEFVRGDFMTLKVTGATTHSCFSRQSFFLSVCRQLRASH
jgi:hypothetical protein